MRWRNFNITVNCKKQRHFLRSSRENIWERKYFPAVFAQFIQAEAHIRQCFQSTLLQSTLNFSYSMFCPSQLFFHSTLFPVVFILLWQFLPVGIFLFDLLSQLGFFSFDVMSHSALIFSIYCLSTFYPVSVFTSTFCQWIPAMHWEFIVNHRVKCDDHWCIFLPT